MDNFKAVYKILTALEKAIDLEEFDIGFENLVSYERCKATLFYLIVQS